jgi:hypothetical protein
MNVKRALRIVMLGADKGDRSRGGSSMTNEDATTECINWRKRRLIQQNRPNRDMAVYSITSSARASTDDGMVRPRALAVLRLIAKVLADVRYRIGAAYGHL